MTLVGKAAAPQNMEQQAVSSKRLRVSGWFLAALCLRGRFPDLRISRWSFLVG